MRDFGLDGDTAEPSSAAHSDERENPIGEIEGLVELEPEVVPDRLHVADALDEALPPVAHARLYPASRLAHLNFGVDELEHGRGVAALERLVGAANPIEVAHSLGRWAR